MAARGRLGKERVRTAAVLLRRVVLRESDLLVDLFTERTGSWSAIARGARRSARRFPALEPLHELGVTLDVSPARDVATLVEASIVRPRVVLTADLEAMDAAGRALRWLRRAAPAHVPEPAMWHEIVQLLDDLNEPGAGTRALGLVAAAGLRLLRQAGWGLELTHCVSCGRPCPPDAAVLVVAQAGGVVCRRCGGRGTRVSSTDRAALVAALDEGRRVESDEVARVAVALVDEALEVHSRGEPL
jgi:DNA repair protein RecO (recombination protein O)